VNVDARDFGRLEGKVDQVLEQQKSINDRLRALELTGAHSSGRQSVINVSVSTVVAGVTAWLVKTLA
jgi:hypothetical protein